MHDSDSRVRTSHDSYSPVREVSSRLRVSDSMVYKLIKEGQLHAVRVGTALRIPDDSLEKYLASIRDDA